MGVLLVCHIDKPCNLVILTPSGVCCGPAPFFAYLGLLYDENDLASCVIFLRCFRQLDRLIASPPLDQEGSFCFSF